MLHVDEATTTPVRMSCRGVFQARPSMAATGAVVRANGAVVDVEGRFVRPRGAAVAWPRSPPDDVARTSPIRRPRYVYLWLVNFLLHHHLAFVDLGRPEAAAGAMLPDVWRMADRRGRTRGLEAAQPEGVVGSVSDGVAHHLAVDAWFHGAEVFTRGETRTREALRRARDAPKMGLFAHVAWELCLDGALLRRAGIESVLRAVRTSLAAVRPDAHRCAAALHTPIEPGGRAAFESRVERILDAIAHGPWVAGYATPGGVVERLEGVRARLGFAPLSAPDRDAVATAIDALAPHADAGVDAILTARRHE
jgi:hypothetical protein